MTTVVDLGEMLAHRRKALKMTQTQVGREAGLRQEVVSRLENGQQTDFSVSKLLRLAAVLNLALTLTPSVSSRPTLETLLVERKAGANTGPTAR
jgi:transcriptional regulator with XRE-family HTH domain